MNTNSTLQTDDVLDLLFANRNKSYGAYQLRRNYNKRLMIALIIMLTFCLLLSSIYKLQTANQHPVASVDLFTDVTLQNTPVKEHSPIVQPPQIKPAHVEPMHVATIKVTPPVIVADRLVTIPPATQDAMEGIKIDMATTTGIKGDLAIPPVNAGTGTLESLVKTTDVETDVHFVQQQAQFPGGLDAWKKFLERNLRSAIPTENGAATGSYTVVVSFLVNKEGNISEVKAENDPGYGTAAEAVRVIQRGPQWMPAVQNGRNVIYRQKQSITFVVAEQE